MSRGELCTSYVRLAGGATADDLRAALDDAYRGEPFVHVAPRACCRRRRTCAAPITCRSACSPTAYPGRAIIVSVLDNLVKGSAGQALQNMNIAFGLDETAGLLQLPLFP